MKIVGAMETYYSILWQIYGEPTIGPDSNELDKNSVEWHLTLDGHDVEITDYKTYGSTPVNLTYFVIRAKDEAAIDAVKASIKKARKLSAVKFKKSFR